MDRVFESVPAGRVWPLGFLPGSAARQYPRMNVAEGEDSYLVEALAPGVDPAKLEVTIKEDVLTVSGEKKAPEGVGSDAFHRSERAAGRFVRSLELPGEVDVEKVKASYVDGILTLTLPKAERAKARRIEIAAS
jgi:HSP20 family protein